MSRGSGDEERADDWLHWSCNSYEAAHNRLSEVMGTPTNKINFLVSIYAFSQTCG